MNNFYPEEVIEEIRISNDIIDVVSEYVKLDKKGANYFGLCPFHKEKTPSFSVAPHKQMFHCFGCGKGGNVIQFIKYAENLDFVEAIRHLADRAKILLPESQDSQEQEKIKLRQDIIKINTEAARFFFNELAARENSSPGLYLKKRGITQQTIRRFGLGYSPEGWDSLFKHLTGKGYEPDVLIKSGLILPGKNGGYYDKFRNRILFPIFDIRGNTIGFGGRVIDASMPKYMNSSETAAFNKGRNLYALNFAKNSGTKRLIIVEGYMDVISLHQNGIINTVASLGTALTENQGRILKKYAEEVIISYDSDTAGEAATMRGLDLLNDIGCNVKVLVVPQGKDPDEFIRKNGAGEFASLIEKAISLLEYKIRNLKSHINTDTTEGKIGFLNKMADLLSRVENRVEREMYIKKLAGEYEITEEAIITEVLRRIKPKSNFKAPIINSGDLSKKTEIKSAENDNNKIAYYEKMLLALLSIENSLYKLVKSKLGIDDFTNDDNKKAAEFVYSRLENKRDVVSGELAGFFENESVNSFARIVHQECNYEDNSKAVLDIIRKIELIKLDKRQNEILAILSDKDKHIEGNVEKLKLELNALIIKKRNI